MAAKEQEYRRLPGRGVRRGAFLQVTATFSRLWLGRDHVLLVDSTGYSEDYKRFFFCDIQAIAITKTPRGRNWNVFFVAVALPAALLAAVAGPVGAVVFGIIAGALALMLLANVARGPTAICHLRTAVQTEELPSLNRLRRARKVLARIRPLIIAAQGELSPEEIRARVATLPVSGTELAPNVPPVIGPVPRQLTHYHGRAHAILCWLLLADVPSTALRALLNLRWLDGLGMVLLLVTAIIAVIALVKQRETDIPKSLRSIPWLSLASAGLFCAASVVYGFYLAIKSAGKPMELSPWHDAVTLTLSVVSTSISMVLGLFGLSMLREFRRATAAPAPPEVAVSAPPVSGHE
jgi:hypothetical protein